MAARRRRNPRQADALLVAKWSLLAMSPITATPSPTTAPAETASALKSRALRRGLVIPALPLALNPARRLDERRQRALLRYYSAAGAGGVATAVHTTQFGIRDPKVRL